MKRWYSFRSKDRKVKGYALEKGKQYVAILVGYPRNELIIERVRWNGEEFVTIKS